MHFSLPPPLPVRRRSLPPESPENTPGGLGGRWEHGRLRGGEKEKKTRK